METKQTGRLPGWLRHAWHWLACILLLAVCITALQRTLQDNYTGQWQVDGFLDQPKNSLDVVFFGSSNMYRTVRPQQLLEETGLKGWNFGASSQFFSATGLYLETALKHQSPRVAVVEVMSLPEPPENTNREMLYWSLTPLPLSTEKLSFLWEYFQGDLQQIIPYVCNLYQFHSRWENVDLAQQQATREQKKEEFLQSRGYRTSEEITKVYHKELETADELPAENVKQLERMAQLCRENGVELVLFKSPNSDWSQKNSRKVARLAQQMGIPYLDYNSPELEQAIGLDYEHDFCDDVHVNVWGAEKVTRHLGEYLQQNYF